MHTKGSLMHKCDPEPQELLPGATTSVWTAVHSSAGVESIHLVCALALSLVC